MATTDIFACFLQNFEFCGDKPKKVWYNKKRWTQSAFCGGVVFKFYDFMCHTWHKDKKRGIICMKKTVLREYARLLVKSGIAVKKGDYVIVNAGLDQPEFVKMVVEECYRAKAARVMVEWSYQPLTKLNVNNMSQKLLGTVEAFEEEKLKFRLDKNPAMLYLTSEDPDGLKGVNQKKMAAAMIAKQKVIKPYREKMDNKIGRAHV